MFTIAILTWLASALAQIFPPPPPPLPPPPALTRAADPELGQRRFRICAACHNIARGGANTIGPNLFGVMDRPAGQVAGYRYSHALMTRAAAGLVWNDETMRAYLTNPRIFLPGSSMAFAGIKDEQQLADMIAYLRTLK